MIRDALAGGWLNPRVGPVTWPAPGEAPRAPGAGPDAWPENQAGDDKLGGRPLPHGGRGVAMRPGEPEGRRGVELGQYASLERSRGRRTKAVPDRVRLGVGELAVAHLEGELLAVQDGGEGVCGTHVARRRDAEAVHHRACSGAPGDEDGVVAHDHVDGRDT